MSQKKIGVSYSRETEGSCPHAGAVDRFVNELRTRNVEVVRDDDELKHGESIRQFMKELALGEHLCVFLSEAYLRSENTMYELQVAWDRSRHVESELADRLHVWAMDGLDIHKAETRLEARKYWKEELKKREDLLTQNGIGGIGPREFEKLEFIRAFANHVVEMLNYFSDRLSPRKVEEFVDWIAEDEPEEPVTDEEIEIVYDEIISAVNTRLEQNNALADFCLTTTTQSVEKKGESCGLKDRVRDEAYCPSEDLTKFANALSANKLFEIQSTDDVHLFAAGLGSLGIHPVWLAKTKRALQAGKITYPGVYETLPIDGAKAHLVPMLAAALAGAVVNLDHVFNFGGLKEYLRGPVAVRWTNPEDRTKGIKRYLIRQVLGEDYELSEDASDTTLDSAYKLVLRSIRSAHKEGRPKLGKGKKMEQIKVEFRLDDLIIIEPDGEGLEDEFFPEVFDILTQLKKIYDTISAT